MHNHHDAISIIVGSVGAPSEGEGDPLTEIAEELISCVKRGDKSGCAEALRAAFSQLESEPHEEAGEVE